MPIISDAELASLRAAAANALAAVDVLIPIAAGKKAELVPLVATSSQDRAGSLANAIRAEAVVGTAPPITAVQKSTEMRSGTGATGSCSFAKAVTAGNYLIVVVGCYKGGITSVVGAVNGAFTKVLEALSEDTNQMSVWVRANALAAAAGQEVITITPAVPSTGYASGGAMEFSGIAGVDKTNVTLASLTATLTAPTTKAKSLILTGSINDPGAQDNFGLPAGFTLFERDNNGDTSTAHQTAYKIVSAIETSTATSTAALVAANYDSFIMSFSAAA